jgi:N-acetylmuramoyl-L-alanine amidase
MRNRAKVGVILPLAILTIGAVSARPAAAEVGASGTRLVLPGGQPRSYMTYGHVDELELYAPLLPELRRLGITFQPQGDKYAVIFRGNKVAEWQVLRSREDVPETAEDPYVLVMGGNVFVPVRALAQRFSLDVKLQKKDNVVALVPVPVKTVKPPTAVTQLPPAAGQVTLQGVEVRQVAGAVQVRVRSSAPVTPKWLTVRAPLPVRIALDFPNSRWADGVQLPAPMGDVQNFRIGMPDARTARLVFEVPSVQVKVTNVSVGTDAVEASIGTGSEAKLANLDPEVRKLLDALSRRQASGTKVTGLGGSRGGGLDDPLIIDPDAQPVIPVDPPKPTVEHLKPLVVTPAVSLVGKTICVDAGHGGHSSGAKGLDNLEKDLCLQMCLSLQRELEQRGARVIMTRDADVFVSLEGRCIIANNANADLFISIHLNSTPTRNSASGTETYWHTPQSQRLARALHRRVVGSFKGEDRGIRNRAFYVIRNTEMPSVLLEVGFINHKTDEALLAQGVFQSRLAESLTRGVLDFFGKDVAGAPSE